MTSPASNSLGIRAMVASQACFSLSDVMVKLAAASMEPGQIMALRGVFGTTIVVALVFATGAAPHWRALGQPLVLLRAAIEGTITVLFVNAIARMPIGVYTAIFLSSPLVITAFAAVFLGTPVGWRRWLAVAAGFCGVLLVAKPSAAGLDPAAWLAAGVAAGVAVRDLVTRALPAHVPSMIVTLATALASTGIGFALAAGGGPMPMPEAPVVLALAAAAAGVSLANFLVILSMRSGDISVVSPFRYSIMPFALIWGWLVWGAVPDVAAAAGIALIVGSGLYAVHRERWLRQRLAAA